LGAVSAILAAPARLDAEQTTALHLLAAPMPQMNFPALRKQVEERLMIKRREFFEVHRLAAKA
jgi:hypothetical protein